MSNSHIPGTMGVLPAGIRHPAGGAFLTPPRGGFRAPPFGGGWCRPFSPPRGKPPPCGPPKPGLNPPLGSGGIFWAPPKKGFFFPARVCGFFSLRTPIGVFGHFQGVPMGAHFFVGGYLFFPLSNARACFGPLIFLDFSWILWAFKKGFSQYIVLEEVSR